MPCQLFRPHSSHQETLLMADVHYLGLLLSSVRQQKSNRRKISCYHYIILCIECSDYTFIPKKTEFQMLTFRQLHRGSYQTIETRMSTQKKNRPKLNNANA